MRYLSDFKTPEEFHYDVLNVMLDFIFTKHPEFYDIYAIKMMERTLERLEQKFSKDSDTYKEYFKDYEWRKGVEKRRAESVEIKEQDNE